MKWSVLIMEKKIVTVKNNGFARALYKKGHELLDFEQNKTDIRKTVFHFRENGTTQSDLDAMINSIER